METWREIVAEMRKHTKVSAADAFYDVVSWVKLCDRIEAACKTLEDVLIVEQDENAKLRRALEPVMKCDAKKVSELFEITCITRHDMRIKQGQKGTYILHTKVAHNENIGDSQRNIDIPFLCNSGNAVRNAQTIMKEEKLFTAKAKTRNKKGHKDEHQ